MTKKRRRINTRRLASERIKILWKIALQRARSDPVTARDIMTTARKVSRRVRMRLPLYMARRICRKCGDILRPGINCRVRVRNNRQTHVTVTCLTCGTIRRFPVTRQR